MFYLKSFFLERVNTFGGFVGEYVGNTIVKKNGKLLLIVETIKDTLHYFTQIDITNTEAFNVDFYRERYDGTLYYDTIKNASKMPMFRIKIEKEEEILVPFGETLTEDEMNSYNDFKSHCVENFATIERKKLATLSFKSLKKNGKQEGPNLQRKKNI